MENESPLELKKLSVPDEFLCQISGDIMRDPVMLTSGRTYEREAIETYFRLQEARIEVAQAEAESDEEFDPTSLFLCPVSMQKVDPKILIPNKRICQATEAFLEQNPWAYNFDPRVKYH